MAENTNITVNLENLNTEEREMLLALIEKANKPQSKLWKPKTNETYYSIHCDGDIHEFTNWDKDSTDKTFAIGNCFRTREEAEFAVERLKVIQELREFAESNPMSPYDSKWCLYYNTEKDIVSFCYNYHTLYSDIYFTSKKNALKAIETVGADRIKKYYFGIK